MKPVITVDFKIAVWDLDGTLLDSFGIFHSLVAEVAVESGYTVPTEETIKLNYHGSLRNSLHAVFGDNLPEAQLDSLLSSFLDKQESHYESVEEHILEDALALSQGMSMRNIRQVIVTNRDHEGRGLASPRSIVTNSSMKEHIEHVISGDDVEFRKPDARVLDEVIVGKYEPNEILVIGDQFVDGELAMNLGAKAILVSRHDGATPHLERLGRGWEEHVCVVNSLHNVTFSEN